LLPLLGAMPLILGGSTWAGIAKHHTGAVPPLATALVLLGYALGFVSMIRSSGGARLAQGALLLVITQGLLGGVTVMYQLPPTILVLHLATSILFLGVLVWFAVRAESPAVDATTQTPRDGTGSGLARIWLPISALAIYLQIVLGAAVRHTGAGLVCIEWLCRGVLWPTNVHPAVHLHMAHRAFAIVVGLVVIAAALLVRHAAMQTHDRLSASLAITMALLVVVQIALGIATIATIKDIWAVTAHLFVAALLFSVCVALTARMGRSSRVATS
jgi:heme A synthase